MKGWSDKAERGSVWLMRLIVWLARAGGRPLCRALLFPIVAYFVVTDATARRASSDFLSAVYGRPARLRDVFRHIYAFATTLLDRVYMATGDFDRFEVSIHGLPLLDEALKRGNGCMLLGSHLGSFDLLMLANRAMDGREVHVMMRVDPRARLRRIAGIVDDGMKLIPLGQADCYLRAYDALAEGGIVCILADRVDGGAAAARASFLSHSAPLPLAPHVLAARSQAAVLLCFGLFEGGNRYRIEFVEFRATAARGSRGAALQPAVDHYAAVLESYARRYPLNWFNFYPYWTAE
ncbi:LpxL/LpxP family acyltransferase [Ramlibacter sp. PS4R-6]|uniref:LpxL/LpxP family acyltransferase n=1 Tax=Ramlibacter sp. PS4R-6 TaxID=3133438 RepID=UPI0030B27381